MDFSHCNLEFEKLTRILLGFFFSKEQVRYLYMKIKKKNTETFNIMLTLYATLYKDVKTP